MTDTTLRAADHPYRLAARTSPNDTVVRVGAHAVPVGGDAVSLMAGPCAVEDRDSLLATADVLQRCGIRMLRGGAFKPRTSPYSFQGLGRTGLELLAEARERTGMAIVTEVLATEDVELVAAHADVLQIGTRNMANYRLLDAVGRAGRPVLLKRGMGATIDEFLCAAEYVLAAGNPDVILCERGTRSFEPQVRSSLDLNAVPLLRRLTHLPVIVDPSHAAGDRSLVPAVALGTIAAGAAGAIVEVHHDPASALVDGDQSLDLGEFAQLVDGVAAIARATGRSLDRSTSEVAA